MTATAMPWSAPVTRFAEAIEKAEGSNPAWNNPGDLTVNALGAPTGGVANSEGVLIFADPQDGWNALCHQCALMLTGRSHVYSLDMTLEQVGAKYSDGNSAWAKNVAFFLGVPETTTLRQLAVP